MRPLYQRLQRRGFNGNGRTDRASLQESYRCTTTDAQIVRPYKGLVVLLYYNGRTTVRPYGGPLVSCGYPICEVIPPECL